ncbi:metallophosphoesterase family protein [Streptomyces gardneri]|uniref:metallophosphoesterase family protein n=1 Tax=Streptomyces gardneri TaxID=66892 RepID=UPI0037D59E34
MGFRFDLASSNIVSYLISDETPPPRITESELRDFLASIANSDRIISSSPKWTDGIHWAAESALERLHAASPPKDSQFTGEECLDPSVTATLLRELAHVLREFSIYILPVGTWHDSQILDSFAYEAANFPGDHILVLIPAFYDADSNIRILNPGSGVKAAIKNRNLWPGAIFLLKTGNSTFLPLHEAHAKLAKIADVLHDDRAETIYGPDLSRMWSILSEPARGASESRNHRRRLIHLSDLHLGTKRARKTQHLLQMAVKRECDSVDEIVISGDLFDQPLKRHRQAYEDFISHMIQLTGKRPVVVPGNHDQRIFGNSIATAIGRWRGQLVDLDWSRGIKCNPQAKIAFFCFDSSRVGNLARGRVDRDQLIQMATKFNEENLRDELEEYLRVAVLHHHPYPYPHDPEKEKAILDPRTWRGKEKFVEMRDAQTFLSWCAGKDINLILHGHKHIPRLIVDDVPTGQPDEYTHITTAGCGTSLGANDAPMSFNVVEWNPQSLSWTVDFQVDRGDGQNFYSAAIESPPMSA